MTDEVPDSNDPWFVHETITDTASEGAPYQAYYGPYSKDYANEFAADLETRFHDRDAALTNPDGPAPAPSTRSQALEVVPASAFDQTAQANLQPEVEEEALSGSVPGVPDPSGPIVEDAPVAEDAPVEDVPAEPAAE